MTDESNFLDEIQKQGEQEIDEKTQAKINEPLTSEKRIIPLEHFIQDVVEKLENNTIDPYMPSTLFNKEVYENLSEADEGRADMAARNICAMLMQVKNLWDLNHERSTAMVDIIQSIKLSKARVEEEIGDVFII